MASCPSINNALKQRVISPALLRFRLLIPSLLRYWKEETWTFFLNVSRYDMTSLVGVGSCLHVYHIGMSSYSQVKHGEIREDLKGIVLRICKSSKAFIYVISICTYYIKHQGEITVTFVAHLNYQITLVDLKK